MSNGHHPNSGRVQFATLTGRLPGAIATTVVWGPEAADVIAQLFVPRHPLPPERWPLNAIRYGNWRFDRDPSIDTLSATSQPAGEDLVVSRIDAEHFEIQSHAGFAVAIIQSSLRWAGAAEALPQEFSHQHQNRWVAEVESVLAQATTQRGSTLLLNQWWLWQKWGPQLDRRIAGQELAPLIHSSLEWSRFGEHLTRPFEVVLCGQPNVGKSSLVNAILGFNRSIVHDQPGTTRDVVSQTTAIDGWLVNLSDTAGLRETSDSIEATGIDYARRQIVDADCLVLVSDATQTAQDRSQPLAGNRHADLWVVNKTDLVLSSSAIDQALLTSAQTGQGIAELLSAISRHLVPSLPPAELPIPVTPSMIQWLTEIAAAPSV